MADYDSSAPLEPLMITSQINASNRRYWMGKISLTGTIFWSIHVYRTLWMLLITLVLSLKGCFEENGNLSIFMADNGK